MALDDAELRRVAKLFVKVKELGRTRPCGQVARMVGLPYDVVHKLLMAESYTRFEASLLKEVADGREKGERRV